MPGRELGPTMGRLLHVHRSQISGTVLRRLLGFGATAVAAVALVAAPASAHNEFEPATAAPGSIIALKLFVEDEQPSAGTTKVELQFPQALTVVELPTVPGWTATPVGGQVGGTATGVTWTGPAAPDDLELPLTLGPLPTSPGRLQFKAVQTYDNGDVERWIDEWAQGAPEPEHPGPVLDLVAGGPGTIPSTTAAPATTTSTTLATTTTTEADTAAPAEDDDEDDDSSALPLILLGIVVLAGAGATAYVLLNRRRSAAPDEPSDESDSGA